ncbi:hypothetical protein TNCV_4703921 [Trichonephila clavipes]|nr:hypothetical protein TNCV_4703921 [Trichonephila clavipes]
MVPLKKKCHISMEPIGVGRNKDLKHLQVLQLRDEDPCQVNLLLIRYGDRKRPLRLLWKSEARWNVNSKNLIYYPDKNSPFEAPRPLRKVKRTVWCDIGWQTRGMYVINGTRHNILSTPEIKMICILFQNNNVHYEALRTNAAWSTLVYYCPALVTSGTTVAYDAKFVYA